MRQGSPIPLTIALSAIVHVALFGAAHLLPDPPHLQHDPPVTIELVPPLPVAPSTEQAPPIDVVFLDPPVDPPVDPRIDSRIDPPPNVDRGPSAEPPAAIDATRGDPGRIDQRGTSTSEATTVAITTPGPSSDAPPSRNPYLDMRRAPSPRVAVRGWDDLEHVPRGTAPEQDISTGQLAPDGGGTHKSDQGAFTAKVAKDGSVTLKDKKNFHIRLTLPSAKDIGDMFQAWYYDPNKPVGTLGPPNMPKRQANLTREDISGAERLSGDDSPVYAHEKDPNPSSGGGIPIAAGGFDITDAFMRSNGVDPYASKKLAFLDSTRDERVRIGQKYKREQLAQVAQIVKKNLARVWAATEDPQLRKQALFEMWDECVEIGSAEVVEAAATARKMIIGFIRANFPADGPHPYTAAEIAACNRAKQSKAPFSPYE
ncbi:MAG: hypothetical protein AB7T06_11480 [Kofleriaceae bacterium]